MLYVSFDASGSSVDPSASLMSYFWDFGDGNTDTTGYYQEGHATIQVLTRLDCS
jgi:PKD domain-containing protein